MVRSRAVIVAPFSPTVRMLKFGVIKSLMCECVAQSLGAKHFVKLQSAHHKALLRVSGFHCRADRTNLSYT